MHPSADRTRASRVAAWLLGACAIVLLAMASIATGEPRVDNPHGKFKEDCQLCHNAKSWKLVRVSPKFDHARYGFPLTGAHATSDCKACHTTLEFSQSKTACASCHEDPHRGEMGDACARCHGARSFVDRGPMVRAHAQSRFPLTGSHAAADCESCHPPAAQGQLQYKGTSVECRACHMPQYQQARDPDHVGGGFPTDCQACHGSTVWTTASFNHDRTAFPLTGRHRAASCGQCHASGRFKGTATACIACHQADYDRAQPAHPAAGFVAAACASCHNTTSFSGATFDHNLTMFPLTGAHVGAACSSCHGDGVYAGKSTACYSCHSADYAGASPPHDPVNYPQPGCVCHNTTTWSGATSFDHTAGGFPLTGLHATPPRTCGDCHSGVYTSTSPQCFSCHAADYSGASPRHDAGNFPTATSNCIACHPAANTAHVTWSGGTFANHTWFPIASGRHAGIACMDCHNSAANLASYSCAISCHSHDVAQHPHTSGFSLTTVETQCYVCHPRGNGG